MALLSNSSLNYHLRRLGFGFGILLIAALGLAGGAGVSYFVYYVLYVWLDLPLDYVRWFVSGSLFILGLAYFVGGLFPRVIQKPPKAP